MRYSKLTENEHRVLRLQARIALMQDMLEAYELVEGYPKLSGTLALAEMHLEEARDMLQCAPETGGCDEPVT